MTYAHEHSHCSTSGHRIPVNIGIHTSNHCNGATGIDSRQESKDQKSWIIRGQSASHCENRKAEEG